MVDVTDLPREGLDDDRASMVKATFDYRLLFLHRAFPSSGVERIQGNRVGKPRGKNKHSRCDLITQRAPIKNLRMYVCVCVFFPSSSFWTMRSRFDRTRRDLSC